LGPLKIIPIELLEQEKLVLDVVQEYLDKNRYFNMKEILPFINSRFKMASINLNTRGIEEVLRSLVKKKLIVEGSKLSSKDILTIKKRKMIYNFILRNPGTYFYKIVRELKLSNHVVVWHLNILLKFNFIKMEELENHNIYFDSNFNEKDREFRYFISKERSKKIVECIKKNYFGITKTQLSIDLGMHINTITKYLESLEYFNVITKEKISKKRLFFFNENFTEDSY
jgi:predicted transcriptional regulator